MVLSFIFAAATDGSDAGKAIAVGVGGGLGAVGAGVGIGIIFGKVIESVTRQPEMRDEITSIQWLGFALTEACFFYGLVAGPIPFFLLASDEPATRSQRRRSARTRRPRDRDDDLDADRLRHRLHRPVEGRVPADHRGAGQAPADDRGLDRLGGAHQARGRRTAPGIPRAAL